MTSTALRLDRFCQVWQDASGAWHWRCRLCDPDPAPFSGRTWSHPLAAADADEHMRTWHTNDAITKTFNSRRAA